MSSTRVRRARPDEWRAVGEVLARSFWDDPCWAWVCADPVRMRRHLGLALGRAVRPKIDHGWVWTVDGVPGAAVWAAPGRWRQPVREGLPSLPAFARAVGLRHVPRGLRAVQAMEHGHPREEHWYLEILGVHPDQQGRGLGSALMQPVLDQCRTEGLPAYLESSTDRSALLYRRHGFEELERFPMGPGSPLQRRMWRPAG
ncbi:MAG: GNAT family N-acetyltransferase [Actinomycetes bacterium]